MIVEQYKIIRIAQAETIRHQRDLWMFIERSLRIKKRYFKTFSEDRINVSGPFQVRVEMYTKIIAVCSRDSASPLMNFSVSNE